MFTLKVIQTIDLCLIGFALCVALYNLATDPGGNHEHQPINDFCTATMAIIGIVNVVVLPFVAISLGIYRIWH